MSKRDQYPPEVAELFPSLERLARVRRGRVPYIQQLETADCGAACLAMVLGLFGREVTLDEVRESIGGSGRDGSNAQEIIRAAEWYGLRGRGLSLDVEHLHYLPQGTILHWEFKHFVVFERVTRKGVEIVDPNMGRRIVQFNRFREAFTGVALVFEPADTFEHRKRGKGRIAWYRRRILDQRHIVGRVLVTSILLRVFALALPLVTAVIVDRVVPHGDKNLLIVLASGIAGLVLFNLITTLVRAHLLLQLRTNIDTQLSLGFVDYLSRLPFDFFQRRTTGDLVMRVNSNATLREMLTTNTLSTLMDGILVIGYAVMIFLLSPVMGLILVGLAMLQLAIFIYARPGYRDLMGRSLEAQSRQQSYLVEMLAGMETLKSAAAEARGVERWSNLYVDELNVALERGRLAALVEAFSGVVAMASPIVVLIVGALYVMNGALTLGEMLAVNALAIGVLTPLASLVNGALQLQMLGGYMDRIDDVLRTDPEQAGDEVARAPKLTGRVTLQNVSFRYGSALPFVVRDVTLDIKAGMTIAIVGKSGCGKSTLARMIAGLYRPTEGRILFDGHDVNRLELKSLRRQIGVVSQAPSLFADSVRNAIALTLPTASFDQVMDAARRAVIHDDIKAMPMGYDTLLTDRGQSLSGGQRQRLALARALITSPAILILDEATSALDSETERLVIRNLEQLRCTQIVLAHRLSTIVNADLILVMENGEIVESGTHKELIDRGQHYSRLVAAQMQGQRGVA